MLKGSSTYFISIDPQNTVVQAISLAKCENRCHETESWSYTDKRCLFLKSQIEKKTLKNYMTQFYFESNFMSRLFICDLNSYYILSCYPFPSICLYFISRLKLYQTNASNKFFTGIKIHNDIEYIMYLFKRHAFLPISPDFFFFFGNIKINISWYFQ